MTLTVDGIDLTPYVASKGIKWQRNDVDGPNAGRSMQGTMIRDRRAIKIRLDVTCRPLYNDEVPVVMKAILPEFVTVKYTDPMEGVEVTKTMYSNNIPAQYQFKDSLGREVWGGITFPLIER